MVDELPIKQVGTLIANALFRSGVTLVVTLSLLAAANGTHADLVASINRVRSTGCDGKRVGIAALRAEARLDAAARAVAGTVPLQRALQEADYRSVKAVVLHISGNIDDAGLARTLQERYCTSIADSAFRDIGVFRNRGNFWAVLAAPFTAPGTPDRAVVARKILDLVNQARAKPRECGRSSHPAAPPLKANRLLDQAAQGHANDMAARSYFSHDGPDGSAPATRVSRAGYVWQMTGENIAAGNISAEETVAGWLRSPPHCVNIMEGHFTELGVGFAVNERSEKGIYWVQVFGRPR